MLILNLFINLIKLFIPKDTIQIKKSKIKQYRIGILFAHFPKGKNKNSHNSLFKRKHIMKSRNRCVHQY